MTAVVVLVLLHLTTIALAAFPCNMTGGTISQGGTIDTSCESVAYTSVTVTGNIVLNISVGGLAQVNRVVKVVNISFVSIWLLNGAVLAVDGYDLSTATTSSARSSVVLAILDVIGSNGGVLFHGRFPPASILLISNGFFTSAAGGAPHFEKWDPFMPSVGKAIVLNNVELTEGASLTISNTSVSTSVIPLYMCGVVSIAASSALLFLNSSIAHQSTSDEFGSVVLCQASVSITDNGTWALEGMFLETAAGGDVLKVLGSTISIQQFSTWSWSDSKFQSAACSAGGNAAVICIRSSRVQIGLGSRWLVARAVLAVVMGKCPLHLAVDSRLDISEGSEWRIAGSNMSSEWHNIDFVNSTLNVTHSSWMILSNSVATTGLSCWYVADSSRLFVHEGSTMLLSSLNTKGGDIRGIARFFNGSSTVLSRMGRMIFSELDVMCGVSCFGVVGVEHAAVAAVDSSQWLFTRCNFSSANQGGLFVYDGNITVVNSSRWDVTGCFFNSTSDSIRVDLSRVVLCNSSYWSFRDTNISVARGSAFYLPQSLVMIGSGSTWSMSATTIHAFNGHAVYIAKTNVSIEGSSRWEVTSSNMTVAANSLGYFLIYIVTCRWNVTDNSSWSFEAGTYYSITIVLAIEKTTVLVARSSSWLVADLSMIAESQFGISLATSTRVEVLNNSQWALQNVTIAVANAFMGMTMDTCMISITAGSQWLIADSSISTSASFPLSFSSVTIRVAESSEWRMERFQLSSGSRADLVNFLGVQVSLTLLSLWIFHQVSSLPSLQSNALVILSTSGVTLDGASAWVVEHCEATGLGARGSPAVVADAKSKVLIQGYSSWILRGNSLSLAGAALCCVSVARVTLSSQGTARILDNSCAGGSDAITFFCAATVEAIDSGSAAVAARCNSANGVMQVAYPFDASWFVQQPCGRCDQILDCFGPLLSYSGFTKLRCQEADGAPTCPCMASCGGGGLTCYPGIGTSGAPAECTGHRLPPLRLTATVSGRHTATVNGTFSQTNEHILESFRANKLPEGFVVTLAASVLFAGAPVAVALQRAHVQQAMNACDEGPDLTLPDISQSPTQMSVRPLDGAEFLRGAVIGNIVLWATCALLSLCAVAVLCYVNRLQLADHGQGIAHQVWSCAGVAGLPGRLYAPFSMLSVPTAAAAVQLLTLHFDSSDAGLGWLGFLLPCAATACFLYITTIGFRAKAVRLDTALEAKEAVLHSLLWFFEPLGEWEDVRGSRGFVAHWRPVFGTYTAERQWFCFVEGSVGIAGGALSGMIPVNGSDALCSRLQSASCALSIAFAVLVGSLKPYAAPVDNALGAANAVLTALSAVLGAFGVSSTSWVIQAQIALNFAGIVALAVSLVVEGEVATRVLRLVRKNVLLPARRSRERESKNNQLRSGGQGSASDKKTAALEDLIRIICTEQTAKLNEQLKSA